jgi:hypothetical protein
LILILHSMLARFPTACTKRKKKKWKKHSWTPPYIFSTSLHLLHPLDIPSLVFPFIDSEEAGRQEVVPLLLWFFWKTDRHDQSMKISAQITRAFPPPPSSSTSSCFLYSTASKWCLRAVCNGAGARQSWWEKRETPPPLTTVYSPSLLNCRAMTWVVVVAAAVSCCRRVESRSG